MKHRPFLFMFAAIIGVALINAMRPSAPAPVAQGDDESQAQSGVVCTVCGPIARGANPIAPPLTQLPGLGEMRFKVLDGIDGAAPTAPGQSARQEPK